MDEFNNNEPIIVNCKKCGKHLAEMYIKNFQIVCKSCGTINNYGNYDIKNQKKSAK